MGSTKKGLTPGSKRWLKENDYPAYREHENLVHAAWAAKNPERMRGYAETQRRKNLQDPDARRKKSEYNKKYRLENWPTIYAKEEEWREKNKERDAENRRRWVSENAEINRRKNKQRYDAEKSAALNYYGGGAATCRCCGETIYEFLTLDHVNNDGHQHRVAIRRDSIYRWAKVNGFPAEPELQILCYNCNLARAKCGGTCPHIRGMYGTDDITSEDTWWRKVHTICLIEISGGDVKCHCCGETGLPFLTIDHVDNDGATHRSLTGKDTAGWLWANNFPDSPRLQVLCYNCNMGRRSSPGHVCPHVTHRETITRSDAIPTPEVHAVQHAASFAEGTTNG